MINEKDFSRRMLTAAAKVKDAIDLKFSLVTGATRQTGTEIVSIEKDHSKWKNAETYARELKVNRKELQCVFKYCYGRGINEYQVEKKIEAACILLASDTMTIKEIATELDFDQEYFSYVFKKKKGLTPTEWKDKYEEGGQP